MTIYSKIAVATLVAGAMACSKSSDSPKKDPGTTATTVPRSTTGPVGRMQQLNLSNALSIQLPDALADSSTGLRLTANKSLEACMMKESIKQSTMMLEGINSTLCYIESQSSTIVEGTPKLFKISMGDMGGGDGPGAGPGSGDGPGAGPGPGPGPGPGLTSGPGMGDQYIGVMVQKTGDVTDVYVCEGESATALTLGQHFKVKGDKVITKNGKEMGVSKGEVRLFNKMMGIEFGASVTFDNYFTAADKSESEFKVRLSGTMDMSGMGLVDDSMKLDMAQYMGLSSVDAGVSTVKLSDRGEFFGEQTLNTSIGKFDATNGNVAGSFKQQSFDDEVKVCVDNASVPVSCDDAKFKEGGALHIAASEVPAFLPADFAAAKPTGFDCAAVAWGTAVAIDPSSAGASSCQMDQDQGGGEDAGCFDGGFVGSEEEFEVPEIPDFGGDEGNDPGQE